MSLFLPAPARLWRALIGPDLTSIVLCRVDKSEHIHKRELGVMFENLRVVGAGASISYQPTVASIFNPRTILEGFKEMRHPATRDILSGFEGVVRPGEMLREYSCNGLKVML